MMVFTELRRVFFLLSKANGSVKLLKISSPTQLSVTESSLYPNNVFLASPDINVQPQENIKTNYFIFLNKLNKTHGCFIKRFSVE